MIYHRRNQDGEGKAGLIVALIILALVIHVGIKLLPAIVTDNEFADHVQDRLQEVAAQTMKEPEFYRNVIAKAWITNLSTSRSFKERERKVNCLNRRSIWATGMEHRAILLNKDWQTAS